MKALKAWLIALTATAGMAWMAMGLLHNGMDANSDSAVTSGQKSSSARSETGDEKRRDGMRGMAMMNGMMSMTGGGMMSGGGMMEGCPMMNDKRPNDQWQPSRPQR